MRAAIRQECGGGRKQKKFPERYSPESRATDRDTGATGASVLKRQLVSTVVEAFSQATPVISTTLSAAD
jgi:hypothetical protein